MWLLVARCRSMRPAYRLRSRCQKLYRLFQSSLQWRSRLQAYSCRRIGRRCPRCSLCHMSPNCFGLRIRSGRGGSNCRREEYRLYCFGRLWMLLDFYLRLAELLHASILAAIVQIAILGTRARTPSLVCTRSTLHVSEIIAESVGCAFCTNGTAGALTARSADILVRSSSPIRPVACLRHRGKDRRVKGEYQVSRQHQGRSRYGEQRLHHEGRRQVLPTINPGITVSK